METTTQHLTAKDWDERAKYVQILHAAQPRKPKRFASAVKRLTNCLRNRQ